MARLVWRPYHQEGKIAQVGISGWYQSPLHKREIIDGEPETQTGYFKFSSNFPTKVDKVTMMSADVQEAKGMFKLSPELLLATGRFAAEAQYYYMNVARNNSLPSYHAHGTYGFLRTLILGANNYTYSMGDACIANPRPGTLEAVAGYSYTDGTNAGIMGGVSHEASLTFNYYINKYMVVRLRYSYNNIRQSSAIDNMHVNIIQARLQFKF